MIGSNVTVTAEQVVVTPPPVQQKIAIVVPLTGRYGTAYFIQSK